MSKKKAALPNRPQWRIRLAVGEHVVEYFEMVVYADNASHALTKAIRAKSRAGLAINTALSSATEIERAPKKGEKG